MSQVKVDSITNQAGTGAPNFPNGLQIGGNDITSGDATLTVNSSSGTTATPTINHGRFIRVGNVVNLVGSLTYVKNASTVDITLDLPAAIQPSSNFASNLEANGPVATVDDLEVINGQVFSSVGTQRIRLILKYTATTATNQTVGFSLQYDAS